MTSRKPLSRYFVLIFALFLAAVLTNLSSAQEDETPAPRDAQSLAERFLGYDGAPLTSPLTPIYNVGDTTEFWVGKTGSETPVRVEATLAAAAPAAYIWVEEGLTVANPQALQQFAAQFSQRSLIYRVRSNYREAPFLPGIGTITDVNDLLPMPDVDNDQHLYILFASDLHNESEVFFSPLDSLPVELAPYSNQHEMLYVNTSAFTDTPLSDPFYGALVTRGIYRWVMNTNFPHQPNWLTEALNWTVLFIIEQADIPSETITAYLQAPDTPLLWEASIVPPLIGGQQLFFAYFQQRYGPDAFIDLFMQSGSGIAPLDTALAEHSILDPATGALVTGRDAYADFVMTDALNFPFGDGRYVQNLIRLPEGQVSASSAISPPLEINGLTVNQFGAQVLTYAAEEAETLEVTFDGDSTIPRLHMSIDRDPTDSYYWSGQGDDQNPTLTRAIDLTGVNSATLNFDAWYNLAPGWNYGYISASTDNGATWQALPATHSTSDNLYGVAYGVGFTGLSTTEEQRPFPSLGVVMSADGITILDVSADGAAAAAGVQPNDVIIGYDNHQWERIPNILSFLSNFAPGDTLHLFIQRGDEQIDIPVLLAAHPTRIALPTPKWLPQTVDLTPYAGQQILLRFETVTLPGREDQGFAIDNLAIPEIDWTDDAESNTPDWALNGWTQIDNILPQQWLVQAATTGTETTIPRVRRLLDVGDNESTGTWRFTLGAGETLVLTVSGINDDTAERATFSLNMTNG